MERREGKKLGKMEKRKIARKDELGGGVAVRRNTKVNEREVKPAEQTVQSCRRNSDGDLNAFSKRCYLDGQSATAYGYCSNCKEHLCEFCFVNHKRNTLSRNHKLLDSNEILKSPQVPVDSLTSHCPKHVGEPARYYCKDHKERLCSLCYKQNHKMMFCDTDLILESEKDLNSEEYNNLLKEETILQDNCAKFIDKLKELRRKSDQSVNNNLSELYEIREQLKVKIEELTSEAVTNIQTSQVANKKQIETVESTCYSIAEILERFSFSIKHLNGTKQSKLFIELKAVSKKIKYFEQSVQKLIESFNLKEYHFQLGPSVKRLLEKEKSMGTVETKQLLDNEISVGTIETAELLGMETPKETVENEALHETEESLGNAETEMLLESENSLRTIEENTMLETMKLMGSIEFETQTSVMEVETDNRESRVTGTNESGKSPILIETDEPFEVRDTGMDSMDESILTLASELEVSLRADETEIEELLRTVNAEPMTVLPRKETERSTGISEGQKLSSKETLTEIYPGSDETVMEMSLGERGYVKENTFDKRQNQQGSQDAISCTSDNVSKAIKSKCCAEIHVAYPHFTSCWIRGMTLLGQDQLIVCDWKNKSIKMIDTETQLIVDWLGSITASDVTKINDNEFAVTLAEEGRVQFVYVEYNKLKLGLSRYVGNDCLGLSYHKERLVVTFANPGRVLIFDNTGAVIPSLCRFNGPCYAATTDSFIYVSDQEMGAVIMLNWNGQFIAKYQGLTCPCGIVVSNNGTVFVCDQATSAVVEVSSDCYQGRVVLKGLSGLSALCLHREQGKLFYSSYTCNQKYDNFIKIIKFTSS